MRGSARAQRLWRRMQPTPRPALATVRRSLLPCFLSMWPSVGCDVETAKPEAAPGDRDAPAVATAEVSDTARNPQTARDPEPTGVPAEGCPAFDGPHRWATAPATGLPEASGLGASRVLPGAWWTHNDSGAGPVALLLDPSGALRTRVRLAGATSLDWEDLAVVQDPQGVSWVYVADMGDNFRRRKKIVLHRFEEPSAAALESRHLRIDPQSVELTYPDGAHDAEALLIDPRTLEVVIVSKERDGHSGVYAIEDPFVGAEDPSQPVPAQPRALRREGTVLFGRQFLRGSELVTAGDVRADGCAVLLRTYSTICHYEREAGESLAQAVMRPCCNVPLAPEPQGEAIAFLPDGSGYATISEGDASPIWGFRAMHETSMRRVHRE